MRVFQFLINPELHKIKFVDCIYYPPQNVYEREYGELFFIGKINPRSRGSLDLLKSLSFYFKDEFYKKPLRSLERKFEETIVKSNSYLREKLKDGGGWWGDVNLVILNIKNKKINLSKTGKMRIHLLRGGRIYELVKKKKGAKELPKMSFERVVSGRVTDDDVLLVCSEEIFDFLEKGGCVEKIKKDLYFDEKWFKNFLEEGKEKLKKIAGICVVFEFTRKIETKERAKIKTVESLSLKKEMVNALEKIVNFKIRIAQQILSNKKIFWILLFLFFLFLSFLYSRLTAK